MPLTGDNILRFPRQETLADIIAQILLDRARYAKLDRKTDRTAEETRDYWLLSERIEKDCAKAASMMSETLGIEWDQIEGAFPTVYAGRAA